MTDHLEVGIFDWIDDARGDPADAYERRLRVVEFAEQAGFARYHVAEHHGTPLGWPHRRTCCCQRSRCVPAGFDSDPLSPCRPAFTRCGRSRRPRCSITSAAAGMTWELAAARSDTS